jgi:hypothetical protein
MASEIQTVMSGYLSTVYPLAEAPTTCKYQRTNEIVGEFRHLFPRLLLYLKGAGQEAPDMGCKAIPVCDPPQGAISVEAQPIRTPDRWPSAFRGDETHLQIQGRKAAVTSAEMQSIQEDKVVRVHNIQSMIHKQANQFVDPLNQCRSRYRKTRTVWTAYATLQRKSYGQEKSEAGSRSDANGQPNTKRQRAVVTKRRKECVHNDVIHDLKATVFDVRNLNYGNIRG